LVSFENFTAEEYVYFESMDYRNRVIHMKFLYLESYDAILEFFALELEKRKSILDLAV